MSILLLDGHSLTVDDLHAVAFVGRRVALHDAARRAMQASRDVVDRIVAEGRVVYGISTGFGKLSESRISVAELGRLQHNLIRSHAAGVGELMPLEETRALMLLRANVLAKGFSGARPEVADRLCSLLNEDVYPAIPCRGSVGASGDLAPLAHLALVLIGEGEVVDAGQRVPSREVLLRLSIPPLELQAKEGLALTNGTQATLGTGVIALRRAGQLVDLADLSGAMTLEALQGTPVAFDPRIHAVRPHPGQRQVAERLLRFLHGSEIRDNHLHCSRVQDAYSLRCMPQVHGPVRDCFEQVLSTVEVEMNSATDNPLVFVESGEVLSGGNFHGQSLGLAFDYIGIALSELASITERRIERLLSPEYGNLPPFLADEPGLNSGFMIAQVTAAALASENKVLSHPASVDSIPTSGNKEDHVAMAMGAALKLKQIVTNLHSILAIEFLCAAQGLDYLQPLRAGAVVQGAYEHIRTQIPHMREDRVLSADIDTMSKIMLEPAFARFAE